MSLSSFANELAKLTPEQLHAYVVANPDLADVVEAALAEHELAHVQAELDPEAGWRANPTTLAHHITRGAVRLWRYSTLLGQKFADAVEGRSTRQIWNLPPQYGKSTLASQWGPVWCLDRHPDRKLILASYGDELAVRNAYTVRDLLRENVATLGVTLRRDQQRQDRFTTLEGGGILATGIDGGATGWPAHGVILDDPFKNWVEAHSATRRTHILNQFRSVFRMRLTTEDAFIILVMTRWHELDLAAELYRLGLTGEGEAWELVRLAEIAEAPVPDATDPVLRLPDPLGRAPGDLLEPERFSERAVAARKLAAASYLWAGMHQQRPAPEEGGVIKRAWWRLDDQTPPRFDTALTSWDMKLKDTETGDFVVGQAWGRTGSDFWCIDQLRGQWDQATTTNAIALLAVRHPGITQHVIENTGNGPEVMTALRSAMPGYEVSNDMASQLGMTGDERDKVSGLRQRGLPGLLPNNPKGKKPVRARAVVPYIEAGNVHLWTRGSWVGGFVDEMSSFPDGANDDQVDAMSQALSRLARGQAAVAAPRGDLPKTPISTRSTNASVTRMPTRIR